MKPRIAKDYKKSAQVFERIVWPQIASLIGGGKYLTAETGATKGLIRDLDVLAGVDGFQKLGRKGPMRSIACRVQHSKEPYDTFTIRYHRANGATTEWEKRLLAINNPDQGWAYPQLTVQAYVHPDRKQLVSASIVRTKELYEYAMKWLEEGREDRLYIRQNWHDGNSFVVIPWQGLEEEGIQLWQYKYDGTGGADDTIN